MLKPLRSRSVRATYPLIDPREIFAAEVERFLSSVSNVGEVRRARDVFGFDLTTSAGARRVLLEDTFVESRGMSPGERREKIVLLLASGNEAGRVPAEFPAEDGDRPVAAEG